MNKAFVSYQEEGKTIKGIFTLIEQTSNFIRIESGKNIITIPYQKLNKMKEVKGGNKE